jgi:heme A synthase
MRFLLTICLALTSLLSFAQAQKDSLGRLINRPSPPATPGYQQPSDNRTWLLTDKETKLAYALLIFLFIIIVLETWLIVKTKLDADNAVKLLLTTLILLSILFIIMVGYDDKVLAPAFGLFGTIMGYLFGRTASKKDDR